jgi:hypothetical protein
MQDDAVTTTWKRLTDKMNRFGSGRTDDARAPPSRVEPGQETCGASARESLPSAGLSIRHSESPGSEGGVAGSTSARAAAAGWPPGRDRDEIRQATSLASWEDEGGTTAI